MTGRRWRSKCPNQRGAALLVAMLLFLIIGISLFLVTTSGANLAIEQEQRTTRALAEAKDGLIAYAVSVVLNTSDDRPGDLPCPDLDDDGSSELSCGDSSGSNQETRLGRLPWRTLGLADIRDGNGERLWYAVSDAFKKKFHTSCNSNTPPFDIAGCLNSDSRGTITVRNSSGEIVHDGTNPDQWTPSGVIAVVLASGQVLRRQGSGATQDRSCIVGTNCDALGRCTTSPGSLTPKCNPLNYLDVLSGTEDNASFSDRTVDGFIAGPVQQSGSIVVNDRIAVITYRDLMPALEKRVVAEVRNCLDLYAQANGGRYPWAADTIASAMGNFTDVSGLRWGRIPDSLTFTASDSSGATPMNANWPGGSCTLGSGLAWWNNWKLHIFYSVAGSFNPGNTDSFPVCASCLTILRNAAGTIPDARYFVAASGKRLPKVNGGQPRSDMGERGNPANYLEGENVLTAPTTDWFVLGPATDSFNDVGIYK